MKVCKACASYFQDIGSRKKNYQFAVRTLRKWQPTNQALYDWITQNNITTNQFAHKVGVTGRTVEAWMFENRIPKEAARSRIKDLTGIEI
jgi:predicted XRE-type DNA-binding protein